MAGPTSRYSRDIFCQGLSDASGNFFLTERVPFRFQLFDDTVERRAVAGDTWWNLAFTYYGEIQDAANLLWYVIADFQPEPVVDPTIAIVPGTTLYIPSVRTVLTEVLAESRRLDFQA